MKIYSLGKQVLDYYRSSIKGNEHVSLELAQRKLTRNVMLADKVEQREFYGLDLYQYGNMDILVDEVRNKIISIKANKEGRNTEFAVDKEKYDKLNAELEIEKYEDECLDRYENFTTKFKDLVGMKNEKINIVHHIITKKKQIIKGLYDNKYFKLIIDNKVGFRWFTKNSELEEYEMEDVMKFMAGVGA